MHTVDDELSDDIFLPDGSPDMSDMPPEHSDTLSVVEANTQDLIENGGQF